jgi:hypothetical protein
VSARLDCRLLTGLCLCYYNETKTFTSGELQVVCVTLISTGRGLFIGVQGGVTDLVKLVTHHVMAGRPWSLASTDVQLPIPLYRLLESVTAARWGRPARGFGWPAYPWAHWPVAFAQCLLVSGTPPG